MIVHSTRIIDGAKHVRIFGEEESMHIFAKKLKNTHVEMPALHQTYDLE